MPEALDGARLDRAVKEHFRLPWSKARAWVGTGKVFLDGNVVLEADSVVRAGQRIELRMGAPRARQTSSLEAEAVVYCDEHLVVVDKPAGLMTVPHRDSAEERTLDRLTQAYLRIHEAKTGRKLGKLGVAHRIDKETSGLVVFARTYPALKGLSHQFREHSIERRYLALTQGAPGTQTMRSRLVQDAGQGRRGSAPEGARNKAGEELGRLAVTHVETLERFGEEAALVACRIETGRTHQIRIHLSELGHPILGDKVYGRSGGAGELASRVMLHAQELGLAHPVTGERMHWERAAPADFQRVLRALRRR